MRLISPVQNDPESIGSLSRHIGFAILICNNTDLQEKYEFLKTFSLFAGFYAGFRKVFGFLILALILVICDRL